MLIYMLKICLVFTMLFNFQDCGKKKTSMENQKDETMITGNFSANTPENPGFLKLDIKDDGSVTFLNVVTLHNPPVEIERLETSLSEQNGKLCFKDKPKTIEQCLVSTGNDSVTVKMIPGDAELVLKRIE